MEIKALEKYKPEKLNSKIWRYMGLAQFINLLETSTLHFSLSHSFEDSLEGIFNSLDYEDVYDIDNDGNIIKCNNIRLDERIIKNSDSIKRILENYQDRLLKSVAINCWHKNEYESNAMWNLYLDNGIGVAIQTTIKSLLESINKSDELILHYGDVNYIDYEKEKIPIDNIYNPFFYKNQYFEHEKEFRIIVNKEGYKYLNDSGINLSIDLNKLIKRVVISPYAPYWYKETINMFLQNRYDIDFNTQKSIVKLRK